MKHVCKVLFSKIGGSLEFSFGHLYFCQNSVLIFFEKSQQNYNVIGIIRYL